MADKITATIHYNGSVVVHGDQGRPGKTISLQDYKDGIDRVCRVGEETLDQPKEEESSKNPFLMPPNVYLFNPGKTITEIGLFYRGRIVPKILFQDRNKKIVEFPNFHLPNIVISVRLTASSDSRNKDIAFAFKDARYFATDAGPLALPSTLIMGPSTGDHIWTLPLPNMHGDARMCYGQNSVISTFTRDLRALHSMYRMIYETPFNNDLSINSVKSEFQEKSPEEWIVRLSKHKGPQFPYEWLQGFTAEQHKQHQAEFQYAATNTSE